MKSPTGKTLVLAPVRANAGLRIAYQAKLDALIDEMNHSFLYWIGATYKKRQPEVARLAQDASPARDLLETMRKLGARWQRNFDVLAPELARWFASATLRRSDAALKSILRRRGFTVKFHMSRAVNDAYQASIGENVSLIKSIPSQYLTQVEGLVMRSVQAGRDLGFLANEIEQQYGITKRRAALISRDQNNKATAIVSRVRQQELGITEAVWMHSAGGKEPRPSHVKAGREQKIYAIAEGWYDPDEGKHIWPGELVNCRCVSRPVLPGFG